MHANAPASVVALLDAFDACGGMIDFVWVGPEPDGSPQSHRAAAIAAMSILADRLATGGGGGVGYHIPYNPALLNGRPVSLAEFWGADDVEPVRLDGPLLAQALPDIDGFKTAFVYPPHGLRGSLAEGIRLFDSIAEHVLGADPAAADIVSWPTDWSDYFDAGNEWWGSFYWTVRPAGVTHIVVIAASATD